MALLKVQTKYGWVEGLPGWNQAVSVFKGIPYAAPPVAERRWKAPQPLTPWDGVYQAYTFPNICYQERRASEGGDDIIGNEFYCVEYPISEDCLYLNVWTPAKSAEEKLPVGIYLHGGGYAQGYGFLNCYDGEGFAKRGCIFVTLNHRLGVFGYLAHPDLSAEDEHHASGNYGTLDIISAIQWVYENIEAFGGDPDKITVFGQSGGGSKTLSMVVSPLTKGLIHGAVMQSGGGIDRTMRDDIPLQEAEETGKKFWDYMNIHSVEEARQADPADILKAIREYTNGDSWAAMDLFLPTIDGYSLPKDCVELALSGEFPDINIMLGSTAGEFIDDQATLPSREKALKDGAAIYGEKNAEAFLKAIHYDDNPELALEMYRVYMMMGSAAQAATFAWCENQLRHKYRPAYQYYITLVPPGAACAHHSVEHHYVFQTLVRSKRPYSGRDWDLSNQLADYWANFIKTGNPNGEGLPQWTPYTERSKETMIIDYDLHMQKVHYNDLTALNIKYDLKEL